MVARCVALTREPNGPFPFFFFRKSLNEPRLAVTLLLVAPLPGPVWAKVSVVGPPTAAAAAAAASWGRAALLTAMLRDCVKIVTQRLGSKFDRDTCLLDLGADLSQSRDEFVD